MHWAAGPLEFAAGAGPPSVREVVGVVTEGRARRPAASCCARALWHHGSESGDRVLFNNVQNEKPDWPAYKKYFMHGTSHHIGLDTHDYGLLHEPMQANMVFTVEPGIYIPDEGFGIRLEDDVVIQESGEPFNLMRNIPIEAEEIEDLMNS